MRYFTESPRDLLSPITSHNRSCTVHDMDTLATYTIDWHDDSLEEARVTRSTDDGGDLVIAIGQVDTVSFVASLPMSPTYGCIMLRQEFLSISESPD